MQTVRRSAQLAKFAPLSYHVQFMFSCYFAQSLNEDILGSFADPQSVPFGEVALTNV